MMANQLTMAQVYGIQALRDQNWSQRRIARELRIHRDTVARYLRLAREGPPPGAPGPPAKPAKVITGSDSENRPDPPAGWDGQNRPNPLAGSDGQNWSNPLAGSEGQNGSHPHAAFALDRPCSVAGLGLEAAVAGQGSWDPAMAVVPQVIAGATASRSRCESFRAIILGKLKQGLSAQRIWQDLRDEHDFADGYQSVQRFVRRLQSARPLPFRRVECEPGQQAQVDFGTGAPVVIPEGQPLPLGVKTRRRKTHVLRIVLSHSRKAYSEVVYRQTAEQFIRCLENAFWYFGGVPQTLVIDNLKAAVTQADWFDPELTPKIQSFCEHYGTVVLPTKPRTPRHKGKTEKGIDYVQANALKGRTFGSLADENRHLLEWEARVADTRIHGTTQKQVKKCFEEVERSALLPLPVNRFPSFQEGRRKVNRDGHVEVDKAYYSVPPEYLAREVWARWDSHVVRIFNHRFEQIALHTRHEPGKFSTQDRHIPREKRSGIERGAAYLLNKAGLIGPQTGQWAEQMVHQRGIEGVRVLMGLLSLSKRHPASAIERACEIALSHGAYRLRTIRELIQRQGDRQEQFAFIDEHPIIRSLRDYSQLVRQSFGGETGSDGFSEVFPRTSFPSGSRIETQIQ